MPNSVRAAAEGLPKISRRSVMGGIAAIPAALAPGAAFASPKGPDIDPSTRRAATELDPLLDLIERYRAGCDAYQCRSRGNRDDEALDALADVTYFPPMRDIEKWTRPAVSRQGATAALRLVLTEIGDFPPSGMLPPLLNAALAYLEAEA
ncbi:twin-arginine translocation signal domain-containing protein [Mesorhizobium sp. M1217]|uniref:twin-arginine translocation signal domain-containing protein n=1 Tax=Mesorhizobium sp. M1217 TaxID=2957070 RepID=UPI00333996DD